MNAAKQLILFGTNWPQRWGLASHWKGDDLADSYGGRTLTNNSATFTAGKVGNAFTLASASSQYLSRASDSGLQIGNNDAWLACWVKLTTKTGSDQVLVSKFEASAGGREWVLQHQNSSDRFIFVARNAADAANVVATANTFGSPSTGVFYFLVAYHDAANDLIAISVNGGAFDTASISGGLLATATVLRFGASSNSGTPVSFLNGQADEVSFGKSPPLGIAALANEIRDRLYNGGNGRIFPWN